MRAIAMLNQCGAPAKCFFPPIFLPSSFSALSYEKGINCETGTLLLCCRSVVPLLCLCLCCCCLLLLLSLRLPFTLPLCRRAASAAASASACDVTTRPWSTAKGNRYRNTVQGAQLLSTHHQQINAQYNQQNKINRKIINN